MSNPMILEVKHLKKYFPVRKGILKRQVGAVKAVDDVSLQLLAGETFGLVGESGCGKSTTGRLILNLLTPTAGEVVFDGVDMSGLTREQTHQMRRRMQMIFQDPYASLNPKMTVEKIITEPYVIYHVGTPEERHQWALELMADVGLSDYHLTRFPHEFSGGQRQRIGIARALALKPQLVVCDEPVSALDVSVRAQVIKLMKDLQQKYNLTYLFISHDLSIVKHISDRVGVMYLGKIMETASKADLFHHPAHPYTQALLSAIPIPDPTRKRNRIVLEGDVPSPMAPPSGCVFHPRCRRCQERCKAEAPELREIGDKHFCACHFPER